MPECVYHAWNISPKGNCKIYNNIIIIKDSKLSLL